MVESTTTYFILFYFASFSPFGKSPKFELNVWKTATTNQEIIPFKWSFKLLLGGFWFQKQLAEWAKYMEEHSQSPIFHKVKIIKREKNCSNPSKLQLLETFAFNKINAFLERKRKTWMRIHENFKSMPRKI